MALKNPAIFTLPPIIVYDTLINVSKFLNIEKDTLLEAMKENAGLLSVREELTYARVEELMKLLQIDKQTFVEIALENPVLFSLSPEFVEENITLRKWYETFGFTHIGTKKFDFFSFTCGYMEKVLDKEKK